MTNKNKQIGDRFENWVVKKLREMGLQANRTYLASQASRTVRGDIRIENTMKAECKKSKYANGFRSLYNWIDGVDFLFLNKTYHRPLVVMNWEMFEELMKLFVEKINEKKVD